MNIEHVPNPVRLGPAALALSTILAGAIAAADTTVLATADQQSIETRALKIVSHREIKDQIEASTRAFASLPVASDPEARRALRPAVEELAFATALDAANSDPSRPKVVWRHQGRRRRRLHNHRG